MNKGKSVLVTGTRGVPNIMGGVETHCQELYSRIAKLGISITVTRRANYVNKDTDEACHVQDNRWNGVNLVDFSCLPQKGVEAFIHTMQSVIYAWLKGYKVVHIHAVGPALFAPIARLLGMKVVFTHHGPDYNRDKWNAFAKTLLKLGERLGCWFANEVIVISEEIKALIAKKYGRTQNVNLIYNGVTSAVACHELDWFEELGIEEGNYVLGMCRFVPEKRLHDLIDAFDKMKGWWLKTKGTECPIKLVLAGDGERNDSYAEELKRKAQMNGVVLTGFVKGQKLQSLLTNARCYCLPSSHEGLPISLLEAMSYGLPAIVTSIPANVEVGLDEKCYFRVGDVSELASKLTEACDGPVQRVNYDMTKYDWDIIAKQVLAVYDKL